MTNKSRYFLVGSAVILLVGLGGGMLAYMLYQRAAGVPAGLPVELRYVPADAQMVAYADVRSVMASDMRRELERMTTGRRGQPPLYEFAGVDLEKDVNRVVLYMPAEPDPPAADADRQLPRVLLLAQGKFEQPRIEQFVTDHGGVIEDHHGKHIVIRHQDAPAPSTLPPGTPPPNTPLPSTQPPNTPPQRRVQRDMAVGFVQPDLIAIGPPELVRQAIDASAATANVTANADLMTLMRGEASANAWVVGRFDAVSRRMGLPSVVRTQMPPLRLVAASATINSGVKAAIRAQTADAAAAEQLRDVVRGAISFARLQARSRPELQDAMKTVELSGTGTDVQLSFMVTPDLLHSFTPQRPPVTPSAP